MFFLLILDNIYGIGFYVFLILGRGGVLIYGKEFDDEILNELKYIGIMFFIV